MVRNPKQRLYETLFVNKLAKIGKGEYEKMDLIFFRGLQNPNLNCIVSFLNKGLLQKSIYTLAH